MGTTKKIWSVFITALLFGACTSDNITTDNKSDLTTGPDIKYCAGEDSTESRLSLESKPPRNYIVWRGGDGIAVKGNGNNVWRYTVGQKYDRQTWAYGSTNDPGTPQGRTYHLCPYENYVGMGQATNGNKYIRFLIPRTQIRRAGDIADGALSIIGTSSTLNQTIYFYNTESIINILYTCYPSEDGMQINSIRLDAAQGDKLNGTFRAYMRDVDYVNAIDSISYETGGDTTIVLTCQTPVTINSGSYKDFNICIPYGYYHAGMRMTVDATINGVPNTTTYTLKQPMTLRRGVVYPTTLQPKHTTTMPMFASAADMNSKIKALVQWQPINVIKFVPYSGFTSDVEVQHDDSNGKIYAQFIADTLSFHTSASKFELPVNASSWFHYFGAIDSIAGLQYLASTETLNMSGLFATLIESQTSLDFSGLSTSNVTNMYGLIRFATNLRFLDLTGWDFSNITTSERGLGSWTLYSDYAVTIKCTPGQEETIRAMFRDATEAASITFVN